jgi:peptide/nickel transport system substrate-binding protein
MSVRSGARGPRRGAGWSAAAAVAVGLAIGLAGCGGSSSGSVAADVSLAGTPAADSFNSADVQTGGQVIWTIGSAVGNWNLLSAAGDTFDGRQVLNGVYPSTFIANPSYAVTMNSDLLDSATQTASSPQTVVYRIKPNAVWSDGAPIDADDFVYAWRVQSGAEAGIGTGGGSVGYERIKSVTGSDGGKTVTVVFRTPFPDWKSLFGPLYPAHIAKQHGDDAASFAWFGAHVPTVSGGPFTVGTVASNGTTVVLDRNARYYGAAAKLDRVVFRTVADSSQESAALRNRQVDGIYPQPGLRLVDQVKNLGGAVTYRLDSGPQFEHIDFNLRNPALGDAAWGRTLRTAMFTAYDRDDVLSKTVKQLQPTATTLDNRMFVPNQSGYRDDVASAGLGTGDIAKAQKLLTDAGFSNATAGGRLTAPDGTAIPSFSMRYALGEQLRQAECDLFAADMARLGITVAVSPTEDIGATLAAGGSGGSGDDGYDIVALNGTAMPFPASADQAQYVTGGRGNYGGYSNAKVDGWLAAAVTSSDQGTVAADLDQADAQISADAYTLPLYQMPTLIAFDPRLGNVRDNGTAAGPTYNIQQWGLRTTDS